MCRNFHYVPKPIFIFILKFDVKIQKTIYFSLFSRKKKSYFLWNSPKFFNFPSFAQKKMFLYFDKFRIFHCNFEISYAPICLE